MQTTVVRREAWDQVGGWDEDAGNPGDNSLYLKLLRDWDVGHVARLACHYRIRTSKPDSWAKRCLNLKEYHALAVKHLANPPAHLAAPVDRISRKLHARLSEMAIPLLRSREGSEVEREALRVWLRNQVWVKTPHGWLFRALDAMGYLGMLEAKNRIEGKLRQWARSRLRRG
jgi:hypothetical protein